MKQEEFFRLLDRRLSVIEDGERRDILEEYRQHIAMKIREDHISEEEALADFGDVDSFADEILSAYHVRTGGTKPASDRLDTTRLRGTLGRGWAKIRGFFGSCGRKTARFFGTCRAKLRGLFRREGKTPRREGRPFWRPLLGRIGAAAATLLRWCFNLLWGGLGLRFWICAAIVLVLLGACAVLAAQGYPLAGTVVVLLGLLLVNGALAALLSGMIRKKEVHHEVE